MGETRVDLLHLLEDLRDAYPGSLDETILTEIVANSLDSGAGRIAFEVNSTQSTLTVIDNGAGMQRRDFTRYHDVASSTKTRGDGIGFAGVGIKLGLLVCDEVITETRRASSHIASKWHLATRHKAPWKWMNPPPGLVVERGTAVLLKLRNPLSPLLDRGFIEATLRHHYEPLLDPAFDAMLTPLYGHQIQFEINSRTLERRGKEFADRAAIEVRLGRKRKPSALGVMYRDARGLPEDLRGIAISTFGKVIRRGWDWLGVTPTAADLVGGAIEAPELAGCLTLNKGDFIRTGARGAIYLGYRRAIQSIVSRQLTEWGDAKDTAEHTHRRLARPIERDLENVLVDLADDFPMLASLVERRLGGQRKLPMGRPARAENARELIASSIAGASEAQAGASPPSQKPEGEATGKPEDGSPSPVPQTAFPAPTGPPRPARYGLAIQFESRSDDSELARLVESTVWVNEAHPAYRRAAASRSEGYHLAVAVAMALAPLAVQPAEEHGFVTAFLARWGSELKGK
jgi:hypothetical protein